MLKGMIGKARGLLHGLMPVLVMVIVQIMLAGINVFYKLAAADQFSLSVLVAYRFLFSAACICPVALVVERNKRPKLTWKILFQGFLCGALGGAMAQNLFAKCIALTSATFAAAATNLVPVFIFIFALIFRLEKLGWRTAAGKAKIFGTILSISGAMLLTFYKGPEVDLWKSHVDLLTKVKQHSQHGTVAPQHSTNMALGAILGLCFIICYSLWFIIQAKMAENYPCPYSSTALMSVMASIQGLVYALCTERDLSQWKLGWNIRLFTVAYAGILAHALTFTLIAWGVQMRGPLFVSSFNPLLLVLVAILCREFYLVQGILAHALTFTLIAWGVQMRGPLFVSSFNPLLLVLVAIAGFILLEEQLHLGSVLGAIVIVCGLYMVIWGKGAELKKMLQLVPEAAEGIAIQEKDANESKQVEIDIATSDNYD